ncbi:MAG TPA: hypothetical protein VN539_08195 [Candidatus Saccharimonadales bacterium]|nr:hypothetical protein [Candidatus Saccharimonadales bacterium]
MPGSYWIEAERRLVFTRGWGVLTDDELLAHARTLRADSRFVRSYGQIVDFRELSKVEVTSDGIILLARQNPFPPEARRAVVVSTDLVFGMTRMFQGHMEATSEQFGIFREIEPAYEWVGLDRATPWPDRPPDASF